MAVRPILVFPDNRLTHPSEPVSDFGPVLQSLLADLWHTLYASPGVGLAAIQIGVLKRISVIDLNRKSKKGAANNGPKPYVIINPVLLEGRGEQIPREGCLSVPDLLGNVRRYSRVTIKSQDEHGQWIHREAMGFEALALQHEMDHMDGRLFLDRIADLKSDLFRRKNS